MVVMNTEEALRHDVELLGLVLNHLNKIAYLVKYKREEGVTHDKFTYLRRCSLLRATIARHLALARHDLKNLEKYAQVLSLGELRETQIDCLKGSNMSQHALKTLNEMVEREAKRLKIPLGDEEQS